MIAAQSKYAYEVIFKLHFKIGTVYNSITPAEIAQCDFFHYPLLSHSRNEYSCGWNYLFEKQMNRIKIFLSSVQKKFVSERRRIADYIRHDTLPEFHQDNFRVAIWWLDKKEYKKKYKKSCIIFFIVSQTPANLPLPLSTPS